MLVHAVIGTVLWHCPRCGADFRRSVIVERCRECGVQLEAEAPAPSQLIPASACGHTCGASSVDPYMRDVPLSSIGRVPAELVRKLTSELAQLLTLADVLAWARRATPPREVAEIVTQDEYTHDVVIPWDGDHYLVFDAT